MKDILIYIGMTVAVLVVVYGFGNIASKTMADHEIISPAPGVQCVVVSRMFNTSVDCWKR